MKKFLFLIILLACFYLFRSDLLTAYGKWFTVNTATQGADVMVILSGNVDTRPAHAARLYHEGYANQVFLTTARNYNEQISERIKDLNAYAELELLEKGVPVQWLPSRSQKGVRSTFDEAYDVVDLVRENPSIQHIILVTDAYHTRRALYAFEKVFQAQGLEYIDLEAAAAPNEIFDESNWFTNEKGLVEYVNEAIKLVFYAFNSASLTFVDPR